jgi:IS4 transposase
MVQNVSRSTIPIDEVVIPHTISDEFDRFRDVIVADGTILRLYEFLAEEFQPRRGEQGRARLHLLHNVTDQTIDQFSLTDEKTHDSTEFDTGPWLEGQ